MLSKIVLVSIPRLSPEPQVGVRVLLSSLAKAGIQAELFDANLDLYKNHSQTDYWKDIEQWGVLQQSKNDTDIGLWTILEKCFQDWAQYIVSKNPTHVGISVFTVESQNWAMWLCYHIRQIDSSIQIILGGRGLNSPGRAEAKFADYCKNWQLCDYYLNGESEKSLVDFMLGNHCEVNNYHTFTINNDLNVDINNIQLDYKEYVFSSEWYDSLPQDNATILNSHTNIKKESTTVLHVKNSDYKLYKTYATRGCVKKCTFCDVPLLRPEFSMRDPINLVEEIQYVIEHHGITDIAFTDDMINGSNKQFMSWLELMASYLERNSINNFRWVSQFGIKSQKSTPVEMFDLLNRTGATLNIGVDHMSDNVLNHMEKKYTRDDIIWFFNQGAKFDNIQYKILLFVPGYPTETQEDFEKLKQGIIELSKHKNQILSWDFGHSCSIPLGSVLENLPGMHLGKTGVSWNYEFNSGLTQEEKVRRLVELESIANKYNLHQTRAHSTSIRVNSWLKSVK